MKQTVHFVSEKSKVSYVLDLTPYSIDQLHELYSQKAISYTEFTAELVSRSTDQSLN